MRKAFLIAGLIACIGTTNSYADIVISQAEESPDMTITVARAGKVATRVTPVMSDVEAQVKAADGGAVAINCPAGCTPDCAIMGNVVLCECKSSDGKTCKAEVVTSELRKQIKLDVSNAIK